MRRNIGLLVLFFFLTITFALLGAGTPSALLRFSLSSRADPVTPRPAGKFSTTNGVALTKAGGSLGIVTALIAFYVGTAELLSDRAHSWFVLPLGPMPKGRTD